MAYQDKVLTCRDCGAQFVFTAGEQAFYAEKGFANEPSRCYDCRQRHKQQRAGRSGGRTMYDAVCAACGAPTQVPFQPGLRPVYCRGCMAANRYAGRR